MPRSVSHLKFWHVFTHEDRLSEVMETLMPFKRVPVDMNIVGVDNLDQSEVWLRPLRLMRPQ